MYTIFIVLMDSPKGTLVSFSLLVLVPLCSSVPSLDLLPTNSEFSFSLFDAFLIKSQQFSLSNCITMCSVSGVVRERVLLTVLPTY